MRKSSSTCSRFEERAERVRSCLAEDPAMTAGAQGSDDRRRRRSVSRRRARGRSRCRAACRRAARRHASLVRTTRTALEHGMAGIDRPRAREDRDLGCLGKSERRAELRVARRGGRVDLLGAPGSLRRRAQHAGADQHGVCDRAQETHQEAVGVVVAGDDGVRVPQPTGSRRRRRAWRRSSRRGCSPRGRGRRRRSRASSGGSGTVGRPASSARTSNGSTPRS